MSLFRLFSQNEIDPPPQRWVRVTPPLDEARRARVRLRVLGEFHEGAGHRLVEVRELEAEDVGLVLDVTREARRRGRDKERDHRAEDEQPREGGGVAARVAAAPAAPPPGPAALEEDLADR